MEEKLYALVRDGIVCMIVALQETEVQQNLQRYVK